MSVDADDQRALADRVVDLDTALQMAEVLTSQLIRHGIASAWNTDEKALIVGAHYEVDDHATRHGAITMHMVALTPSGAQLPLHVTFEVAPAVGFRKEPEPRLTVALVAWLAQQDGIELMGDLADRLA